MFCFFSPDKSEIAIRLVDDGGNELIGSGTIVVSGAIELRLGDEWRSLCCNHWTESDAEVACRELGLFSDGMSHMQHDHLLLIIRTL